MRVFILSFLLMLSSQSYAEITPAKLPGNIAVHIAKRHYEHPVRLLHNFLDVWHMKGPLTEKVAMKVLPKRFANVNMCAASTNADVVLLVEPQMFYNQQLQVFYAEIILKAFTNGTEPITTIKKQAQQNGNLGVKPEFYMEKAYTKAMEKAIKKLEVDKAFLAALEKGGKAETLCAELDNLPVAKIYF